MESHCSVMEKPSSTSVSFKRTYKYCKNYVRSFQISSIRETTTVTVPSWWRYLLNRNKLLNILARYPTSTFATTTETLPLWLQLPMVTFKRSSLSYQEIVSACSLKTLMDRMVCIRLVFTGKLKQYLFWLGEPIWNSAWRTRRATLLCMRLAEDWVLESQGISLRRFRTGNRLWW